MRERVIFLSVPESLAGRILPGTESGFAIDRDIPLPMEVPEGGIAQARAALEDLSWEMIVSGMLRVLASGEGRRDWLDYYRRFVLEIRPDIRLEFSRAAELKAENGEFDLALEILDSLGGLFPDSPEVALDRALVLQRRAKLLERRDSPDAAKAVAETEAAFAEAMSASPPMPDAMFAAGFFFLDRRDFSRARECLSLYVRLAGEDDERADPARAAIREIDDGGLEEAAFTEACALVRDGKEEAGMVAIRSFIEKRPEEWNGWFVLGWALRRLRRWADAAAALARAVDLGGTNCDVRNELAICLMESGDLAGARRQLEAALREDCENVKIVSNLGVLALKSGDGDRAAAFFRTALELDPEDPVVLGFLSAK